MPLSSNLHPHGSLGLIFPPFPPCRSRRLRSCRPCRSGAMSDSGATPAAPDVTEDAPWPTPGTRLGDKRHFSARRNLSPPPVGKQPELCCLQGQPAVLRQLHPPSPLLSLLLLPGKDGLSCPCTAPAPGRCSAGRPRSAPGTSRSGLAGAWLALTSSDGHSGQL